MALGIFGGEDLRPVLGGGICQVATTVYRAAVHAGLPITKRANHSLFVTYYEKYGVGLDATIYPGEQDFTFFNDSPHYLLLQAYAEGDEAVVNVYGTPDGRSVALDGPFLSSNAPDLMIKDRPIKINEIAWKRSVTYTDGRTAEEVLLSRYKAVPKRLKAEYTLVEAQ
jgi:vancomycin resistance protein YoaR